MGSNTKAEDGNNMLDDQVYQDIIAEVDQDQDNEISFNDFKQMMQQLNKPSIGEERQVSYYLPFKPIPENN